MRIAQGIDPVVERQNAKASLVASQRRRMTFSEAAEKYLTTKKLAEFSNAKHAKQWRSTIETYVTPIIGDMAIELVSTADVLKVLQPIWNTKNETATRLRGRIEAVLSWATVSGLRSGDNPARWTGNLKEMLPAPNKTSRVEGHPALAINEAPGWFAKLRMRDGMGARALEFLVLTAARSGEIRGATWAEFDFDERLWTIPAGRMKADREHRVPLTIRMVPLLLALDRFEDCQLVFPSVRGKAMSDMTLSGVMRRMQETELTEGKKGWLDPRSANPAVPHGLRSTFKDWVTEKTEYPSDLAETALAHSVGNRVEQAYRRGDMIEKRRAMMEDWGDFIGR